MPAPPAPAVRRPGNTRDTPGRAPTHHFGIDVEAVTIHTPDRSPIAVGGLHVHGDDPAEDQIGEGLLGTTAVRLMLLGGVDAGKAHLDGVAVHQLPDGVADRDADHLADEQGGVGRKGQERKTRTED